MTQGFHVFTPRDLGHPPQDSADAVDESPRAWQPPGMGTSRPVGDGSLTRFDQTPERDVERVADDPLLESELDALREEARQQGFAKGEADAQALLAQQSQQLQLAIAALRQPMAWLEGEVAEQLEVLACAVAKDLLGRELTADPEWLRSRLHDAVKLLPVAEGRIDLHLNPEDAALLRQVAEQDEPLDPAWTLHEDPDIQRGGSLIRNAQSQVDHRLETRLARLLASSQESADAPEHGI